MADELNVGIIKGSEITPREIEWLWYPYIPFGKLTLLQGDPGEGKSTFALNLAARITRGGKLFNSDDELEPSDDLALPDSAKATPQAEISITNIKNKPNILLIFI